MRVWDLEISIGVGAALGVETIFRDPVLFLWIDFGSAWALRCWSHMLARGTSWHM